MVLHTHGFVLTHLCMHTLPQHNLASIELRFLLHVQLTRRSADLSWRAYYVQTSAVDSRYGIEQDRKGTAAITATPVWDDSSPLHKVSDLIPSSCEFYQES